MGGFDEECQAHKKVIMTLRRINEEVHSLAGTIVGLRFFHLVPEFLVFGRAIGGIHLERPRVDGGKKIEAKQGLGRGGEDEGEDTFAQGVPEERSDRLADTGSIDNDSAAMPDVFQKVDELGVELGVALSGPLVVFNDTD